MSAFKKSCVSLDEHVCVHQDEEIPRRHTELEQGTAEASHTGQRSHEEGDAVGNTDIFEGNPCQHRESEIFVHVAHSEFQGIPEKMQASEVRF